MDVPDDKESELFMVRAYLNTQAAILRDEYKVGDGSKNQNGSVNRADSVDNADVVAVLTESIKGNIGSIEKNINNGNIYFVHWAG